MFGLPIGVNYRGDDHYRTKLGALVSFATYFLIAGNLISLIQCFYDGSKQN